MSSAAVVIGALRVNGSSTVFIQTFGQAYLWSDLEEVVWSVLLPFNQCLKDTSPRSQMDFGKSHEIS